MWPSNRSSNAFDGFGGEAPRSPCALAAARSVGVEASREGLAEGSCRSSDRLKPCAGRWCCSMCDRVFSRPGRGASGRGRRRFSRHGERAAARDRTRRAGVEVCAASGSVPAMRSCLSTAHRTAATHVSMRRLTGAPLRLAVSYAVRPIRNFVCEWVDFSGDSSPSSVGQHDRHPGLAAAHSRGGIFTPLRAVQTQQQQFQASRSISEWARA